MVVLPSIDLYRGWVVKLTGGRPSTARRISRDVATVAERWIGCGASWIHVVDLDAAFRTGSHGRTIAMLLRRFPGTRFEVSGGIRDSAAVRSWLDRGARRVIVGTRAVRDPAWLGRAAREFRRRLFVAVDARGDRIVVHGWTRTAGLRLREYLKKVDALPFGGYLYTDVRVEGRHQGFRPGAVKTLLRLTDKPVLYSGGVRSLAELRALKRLGVSGVILGTALYRGTIDLRAALREIR